MFEKLITRPIFSVVISIVIVIMGIMGLTSLPMTLYPDIAPPVYMSMPDTRELMLRQL